VIAKGNLHGDGAKLIDYMLTAQEGERVEFGGAGGFEFFSDDLREAAGLMQRMAEVITDAEKPWFHTQTRLAPGEHLTRAQWEEVLEREEKRLGFTGLPRAWSFHIDEATGERHMHAAWYRVDVEQERAVDPGLFKLKLKELSRECERDFGLREVSNERKPDDRAKYADRDEVEESRRLGTDVRALRNTILDCLQRSDNGKSLTAALLAHGMVLAAGDRRDCFVVVDQDGGHHALNKRLTGITLEEMRGRLSDLNRAALPSVEEAQEHQARHRDAREARQRHDRPAQAKPREQTNTPSGGHGLAAQTPRNAKPEKSHSKRAERPLNRMQGEIRMALSLTASGAGFAAALEDRGIILAEVRAGDIQRSERAELAAMLDAKANGVWMFAEGGVKGLTPEQLESAKESYETWKRERPPPKSDQAKDKRKPFAFEQYVGYVQKQQRKRFDLLIERVKAMPPAERTAPAEPVLPSYVKQGALVGINGRGQIYALNRRTTGKERAELEKYLGTVDRPSLMSVNDAQSVMRDVKELRAMERAQQRIDAPVGKAAGEIRMAWTLTKEPDQLEEALAARGMTIARVTADEAYLSERVNAFAKEIGNFAPVFKEGELVVVNGFGRVYRFDERTTGNFRPEIDKRLAGIDAGSLMNVTDAKPVIIEARRADNATEREKARPATRIETVIADALKTTMTGHDFAAAIDKAGLTITRATAADLIALDALRRNDELAAATGLEATGRHFAKLEAGEFAAVTRAGDVFRLNPYKLDFTEIEQRLADTQRRMPSVVEARAGYDVARKDKAALSEQRHADHAARRHTSFTASRGDQTIRGTAAKAHRDIRAAKTTAVKTGGKALGIFGRGIFGALAGLLKLFEIAPAAPPSPEQQKRNRYAAKEQQARQQQADRERQRLDDILRQMSRDDQERERQRRERGGYDDDYGRGRERD
jgi:hypothetical protein